VSSAYHAIAAAANRTAARTTIVRAAARRILRP
jgi:hypothetical protein